MGFEPTALCLGSTLVPTFREFWDEVGRFASGREMAVKCQ